MILFFQCLPQSINPPFSDNQIVKDPSILGTWACGKKDSIEGKIVVSDLDSISYLISSEDSSSRGRTVRFRYRGFLTKIDNQLILSLTFPLDDIKDTGSVTALLHIPGYFFTRITRLPGDSLRVDLFDLDRFSMKMERLFSGVQYFKDGNYAIATDRPEKIRKFISKCLKDRKIFNKDPGIYWRLNS